MIALRLFSTVTLPILSAIAIATGGGAAQAETKLFPERKELCVACHGANGVSETPETPSLGDIPEYYALLQLVEFRDGNRASEAMRAAVEGMTDDDLRAAAAFVAAQPSPPAPEGEADPELMERGETLLAENRCAMCHGQDLKGGRQMPPLLHQREDYLLKALSDYKAERRIGDRAAMVEIVTPLSDGDLEALAHYLAHASR